MKGKRKQKNNYSYVDGVLRDSDGDPVFTMENREDYTILIPTMLPVHFALLKNLLKTFGIKNIEILDRIGPEIAETGLKYIHNDTCYPATLVIGELMYAVLSGKYDTHKIALVLAQTGGGCRASNYIFLLKKALKRVGMDYIPILSFNFSGFKIQPGFKFTIPQFYKMLKCMIYGDMIVLLKNQCKPYEANAGETDRMVDFWVEKVSKEFSDKKLFSYKNVKANLEQMVISFSKIERKNIKKPRVGIVGEIFVKYSPLGNNNLEELLVEEGAEVYVPGILDFILYFISTYISDNKLYGVRKLAAVVAKVLYKYVMKIEKDLIKIVQQNGTFEPPTLFENTVKMREGYINEGMKMGEGWLLTAEMIELINRGINNIVCTQPFGCLPNHIVGKGMLKEIRDRNPDANIIAIDYDASASKINQDNRIKLMLSNAKEKLMEE